MSSTEIDIQKIATLARLSLTEAEAAQYQEQLGSILDYVNQISSHDLEGVEPTAHAIPPIENLRPDEPKPGLPQEAVLANAPKVFGDQLQIPNVIE